MSSEKTVTVKQRLALGRTLGVLDAAAAIGGGAAVIALSGGVAPIAFGVAAAATGVYRAIAMAKGWKKPETFITSSTVTTEVDGDTKTVSKVKKGGFQNISIIGSVAKFATAMNLLTLAETTGGLTTAGLVAAGTVTMAAGGGGLLVAATPLMFALPVLAYVGYHKLTRKPLPGNFEVTQNSAPQENKSVGTRLKSGLKSLFNKLSPVSKDRTPIMSAGYTLHDQVSTKTTTIKNPAAV